jgi:hypothetical protein
MEDARKISVGNIAVRTPRGSLGINGMIILMLILQKSGGRFGLNLSDTE